MQSKILKSADKTHINIVVIGHVDSGKSTTTGHLIFKLNNKFDQRKMQKSEKQSIESGKGDSCKFAFFMDTSKEEQKRGITINTSTGQFETNKYKFTIIDAPGHKDFIKNMITGTAQADAALLMISAVAGEFEAGFSKDGTTKEHALLAYTLGVKQIIVCVNKIDEKTVNYSQARFQEITEEVTRWLKKIGFNKTENIPFIPISGFNGDNLIEKNNNVIMDWYKGPTLVETLDTLNPPIRFTNKPLRMPINEIYKIQGIGTVVSGRIETGQVVLGQNIEIGPTGIKSEVKSIEMHHEQLKIGNTGDCVGINLRGGISVGDIKKGYVLGDAKNDPPKEAVSFVAQIIITNHPGQIKEGYTPVIDCHTSHVSCKFNKILSKIDKKTNQVIEENPQFLQANDCAMVEIVPLKPMIIEEFSVYPPLGRFSVRDSNKSVAVGIVKQVVKKQ